MHLVYIDDSKGEKHICFSAILIPADLWIDCLDHMIGMRKQMQLSDGVYQSIELHATDWLGGRGKVSAGIVPKGAHARLFDYVLSAIVCLPGVQIINAFAHETKEMKAFEWLINRIHKNVEKSGSQAIIFSDEGKSYDSLLRRMRRFNHIPSKAGSWSDGNLSKNMPVKRILEDIVYRDSAKSFFVQAADFVAFSLLRFERPTASLTKYGIDQSFLILKPALVTQAFSADPRKLGIIRP